MCLSMRSYVSYYRSVGGGKEPINIMILYAEPWAADLKNPSSRGTSVLIRRSISLRGDPPDRVPASDPLHASQRHVERVMNAYDETKRQLGRIFTRPEFAYRQAQNADNRPSRSQCVRRAREIRRTSARPSSRLIDRSFHAGALLRELSTARGQSSTEIVIRQPVQAFDLALNMPIGITYRHR